MNKISKFVVGITLFLFLGQSFAALTMSCEYPDLLSSKEGSKSEIHASHTISQLAHSSEILKSQSAPALENVSLKANCDSDQHACYCSTGTCSVFFLPTSSHFSISDSAGRPNLALEIYVDHQPSLVFRPPIFS